MKYKGSSSKQHPKNVKVLTAELALGQIPILKEPRLINDWVLWLEQRPQEKGRTSAFIRPWGRSDLSPQELTPSPINLRTRVHEYGGSPVATALKDGQMIMTWIDDSDGCLWLQVLSFPEHLKTHEQKLRVKHPPICLSSTGDGLLADGLIDLHNNRWIGVMEKHDKDFLVSFDLSKEHQKEHVLYSCEDFAGYPALSPDGDQLVWVEWQHPAMPWESSQLWWAQLGKSGELVHKGVLAGSRSKDHHLCSVFQPFWLPNGQLVVAEDSGGWWNLMITGPHISLDNSQEWRHPWPMKAETAMPQWVYGMSTASSAANQILSANCKGGTWRLNLLHPEGLISDVEQPFDDLAYVQSELDHAVVIASNPSQCTGLLEIDLKDGNWMHTPSSQLPIDKDQISIAEPFWFEGYRGEQTHAWYYPPSHGQLGPAPLLVKSHSGPTAMTRRGLNLEVQFWTSRGWGVVDVNYGGSTGFGRQYMERIKYSWGEVDVFDCAAAAKALIDAGKANEKLIAIEGGSAGGFSTLACLCFTDVFRVGACRYAVSDLTSMTTDTHRFEAGYLDYLVGPWSEKHHLYERRSPLMNASRITCPVIFFQGLKDKVVLPEQTEAMAAALRKNNVPVEVHTFPEEGHGFRDKQVKVKVLEDSEKFFRKHLCI